MYPILIGSEALKFYNFKITNNDIDIIVNIDLAKSIVFYSDKKEKNICWFGDKKVDLHMATNLTNKLIFEELNQLHSELNLKVVKLYDNLEVIVAPLEILYAIKKSHIHRILPITNNNQINCKIWHKHMKYYILMRNKLGYERMDKIIYGDKKYGYPQVDIKLMDESYLEYLTRKIFVDRFDEINNKISDTKLSMDKNVNQFFDDNVERFVDHDLLHKKVGLMYRNSEDQLFHKFQKDQNYANLDRDLYFNGEYSDRIQLIREEIVVLFLERKVISELMLCYKKPRIKFNGFNNSVKQEEFNEIIAHFVTNLCDTGHSWLRQYTLDHYETYNDYDSYDMDRVFTLSCKVTNIYNEIEEEKYINILHEINNYDGYNKKYLSKIIQNIENYRKYHTSNTTKIINLNVHQGIDKLEKKIFNLGDNYFSLAHITNYPTVLKEYLDKMTDELLYFSDNDNEEILYSVEKNVGLVMCGSKLEVFYLKVSHSERKNNLVISLNLMEDLDTKEEYVKKYNKRFRTYYYHSDSCTEQPPEEREASYLSSFGNCPGILGIFTELLARIYLKLDKYDYYGDKDYDSTSESEMYGDSDNIINSD